jgi:peptide/nickel transport system substrate-binding protein
MRLRSFLSLAIVSLIALACTHASERPRYGGTLRAELGASVSSLDPGIRATSASEADAKSDLLSLAFETLVGLDANGAPQPRLAISWEPDALARRWTFHLRARVHFHDGAALTPEVASAAIANPDSTWRISSSTDAVIIESDIPTPDLPYVLAESRHALVHRNGDGTFSGTGPFKIAAWEAGKHAVFAANADYWSGRPFLDGVDVALGTKSSARMIDLQLAKADLVDLAPELVRRAADDKFRTSVTVPVELLALVFQTGRATVQDARVREAVARTIDRAAIADFILQKQGETAGGLLPQWLSGSAFLFSASADPAGARELLAHIKPAPALVLGYDSGEALDKAVAERIAVNAREASIAITVREISAASSQSNFDARLVRVRFASPEPRAALADLLETFAPQLGGEALPLPNPATSEEIYERERAALDGYRVVPIAHLPRIYGVGSRVRNWEIREGSALQGWQLADVWIEGEAQ